MSAGAPRRCRGRLPRARRHGCCADLCNTVPCPHPDLDDASGRRRGGGAAERERVGWAPSGRYGRRHVVAVAVVASLPCCAALACSRYQLHHSASFSLGVYGEHAASVLAQYWADKMEHFHDIFVAAGDEEYVFTMEDVASFRQAPSLEHAGCAASRRVLDRLRELRAMKPASK